MHPAPDLVGRVFVATEATGRELVAGSVVRVAFLDGSVSVHAGCNTQRGRATWSDGVLVVAQPMAGTRMACTPELMAQDVWLASFLASSPVVSLDGATLVLGGEDAGLTLEEV